MPLPLVSFRWMPNRAGPEAGAVHSYHSEAIGRLYVARGQGSPGSKVACRKSSSALPRSLNKVAGLANASFGGRVASAGGSSASASSPRRATDATAGRAFQLLTRK